MATRIARGKIFATLDAGETVGMVKLTPEQQAISVHGTRGVSASQGGGGGRVARM